MKPHPNNVKSLSMLLTIVATGLYSYSLLEAKFEIGYLGSISSFPLSFLIALSLLTIASAILWRSPQPHGTLLCLQLGLFIMMLYLSLLAVGGIGAAQPGASALYSEYGLNDYVFRTGHFGPPPDQLWRLYWPVGFLINNGIMSITGMHGANSILVLNIFITILIFPVIIYLFLNNILGKDKVNYCFAGTWIFMLGNFLLLYLTPAIVGYLMLFVIASILASTLAQDQHPVISLPTKMALLPLVLLLPATHLLTAFVAVGMMLALMVMRRINTLDLILLLVFMICAWSVYYTATFMSWNLPAYIANIKDSFRVDMLWSLGVSDRMMGSEAHQVINKLRLLFAAVFCIIGVIGGIIALRDKLNAKRNRFVIATAAGILAVSLIISTSYSHELVQRSFFFLLPVIAFFGVKMLKYRLTAVILTVLLLVALPLRFVNLYGSAVIDYNSPAEISAAYFFHEYTDKGYISSSLLLFPIGFMENREKYTFVLWTQILKWEEGIPEPLGYPYYIYVRAVDDEILDFLGPDTALGIDAITKQHVSELPQHMHGAIEYNLIYVNPDLSIYSAREPQLGIG